MTLVYVAINTGCGTGLDATAGVSIGGLQIPSGNIVRSAYETIEFVVPFGAASDAIEVGGFSGGGFTVFSPNTPALRDQLGNSLVDLAGPSPPQYVEGVWNYDDGNGDYGQFSLQQGTQNPDGSYSVFGSLMHGTIGATSGALL